MSSKEINGRNEIIERWNDRLRLSNQQNNQGLCNAIEKILALYNAMESSEIAFDNERLRTANHLRKQIESSEQHRTMCAEHGLNDAAIDTTLEIQELENQLIQLMSKEEN